MNETHNSPAMTIVCSAAAPQPLGHYSQAILHGDCLYVSGQLGVTRETPDPAEVSIAEQVRFALGNIEAIAACVGCDRRDVVKVTLYVADIRDWDVANQAYAEFFGDHRPSRSVIPLQELHLQAKVEIEAIVAVRYQAM